MIRLPPCKRRGPVQADHKLGAKVGVAGKTVSGVETQTGARNSTAMLYCTTHGGLLHTGVNGFTFQCSNTEHALVDSAQGLMPDEQFQACPSQGKLPQHDTLWTCCQSQFGNRV